jgi:hypothetical protein
MLAADVTPATGTRTGLRQASRLVTVVAEKPLVRFAAAMGTCTQAMPLAAAQFRPPASAPRHRAASAEFGGAARDGAGDCRAGRAGVGNAPGVASARWRAVRSQRPAAGGLTGWLAGAAGGADGDGAGDDGADDARGADGARCAEDARGADDALGADGAGVPSAGGGPSAPAATRWPSAVVGPVPGPRISAYAAMPATASMVPAASARWRGEDPRSLPGSQPAAAPAVVAVREVFAVAGKAGEPGESARLPGPGDPVR